MRRTVGGKVGKKILFAIALHSHQPVGNFDSVFSDAYQKCYKPFLELFEQYPTVKFSLHYSGPLLDWLEEHQPEYIATLRKLADSGRVEIMGGAYYEPILPLLPREDRLGQIAMQAEYTRRTFGQEPEGFWLAERVWEQALVSDLADAGVKYTLVDDSHFKFAGCRQEAITGYYITEDQGRMLRVFAMDEKLRYFIPFRKPEETIEYLAGLATEGGERLLVYADDAEKFGAWPQTYKHIYEDGWLRKFLDLIRDNGDWIETVTLGETQSRLAPLGRIYIPDASYREMMSWALPPEVHEELEDLEEELKKVGLSERSRFFVKGATWRNFQARYAEAGEMYAKMLRVSGKVGAMSRKSKDYEAARKLLYEGQCNCPYWHGVFGGLYLPHLRDAVYTRLIQAETLAEGAKRKKGAVEIGATDYNLDGNDEILASTGAARLAFKPTDGGHLFEFDLVGKAVNILATLSRRREAYHRAVLANHTKTSDDSKTASIHDTIRLRDPEARHKIVYDWYKKESLVDHFFGPDTELKGLSKCRYRELGDFVNMPYEAQFESQGKTGVIRFAREGALWFDEGKSPVRVEKTVSMEASSAVIKVSYELANLAAKEIWVDFGVEFNLALLGGKAHDRYYVSGQGGQNLGNLSTPVDMASTTSFAAVDEWKGVEWWLEFSQSASLWAFPVETASMSEYGIELVYQCSSIIPHWRLKLAAESRWSASITFAPRER